MLTSRVLQTEVSTFENENELFNRSAERAYGGGVSFNDAAKAVQIYPLTAPEMLPLNRSTT